MLQVCDISIIHYAYQDLKDGEEGSERIKLGKDFLQFRTDTGGKEGSEKIKLGKDFLQFRTDTGEILEGNIQDLEDIKIGMWWMVTFPKYPQTRFERETAWRKAERALENPRPYDPVTYNCESFIGDILLNDPKSRQVTNCKKKMVKTVALGKVGIAGGPVAMGFIGAYLVYRVFSEASMFQD